MLCMASEDSLNRTHPIARRGAGVNKIKVIHIPNVPSDFLEEEAWGIMKEGNFSVLFHNWTTYCKRKAFHGLEEEGQEEDGM